LGQGKIHTFPIIYTQNGFRKWMYKESKPGELYNELLTDNLELIKNTSHCGLALLIHSIITETEYSPELLK
jgi:hypothetical protein